MNAKQHFEDYKQKASDFFLQNHGGSYATFQEYGDTWRIKFPYSVTAEVNLINFTKTYLNCLPITLAHNPYFLSSIINEISKYLSVYTIHSGKHKNKNIAKNAIRDELNKTHIVRFVINQQIHKVY